MSPTIEESRDGTPRHGGYDTRPTIQLPEDEQIYRGDDAWQRVADRAGELAADQRLIVVDAYPGTDVPALIAHIRRALPAWDVVNVEDAALPNEQIESRFAHNLTKDRVFGVLSHAAVSEFYDAGALDQVAHDILESGRPTVMVGWGADLLTDRLGGHCALVLVDMARWEIQLRQRAGATNWRADNPDEDNLRKYKRGFFVEWRIADRHKRSLFQRLDFVLDGNAIAPAAEATKPPEAGLITRRGFLGALDAAVRRPFRVVPFFDPGVWGGQWMKSVIGLDPAQQNYAWCFDCVPEENSLLLEGSDGVVELPALDLVLIHPRELLGEKNFARFGAEFPIRFDFLDTMGGENLSLQVHPLTDYIQDVFGMHYTQDESYYLLDAADDAVVYLGLRSGVDPQAMMEDLRAAQDGDHPFPTEKYVNEFPAHKHDHFSIPAGTVHCSGANSMVLEISATPFIFTFKLWDWGRVGLDGIPRPVHLDHGEKNIQWDRDTEWVTHNLVDQVTPISDGAGVREERTGLHELEFIEVRRHWFSDAVNHTTDGTVNVLNLVEGDEVKVVSPTSAFPPMVVHYAETFIVPAAVGAYRIERTEASRSERFATVTAYVRGSRCSDC